nr:RNA-directed DNA polymerase, eukaryota, reverse transcriptase zinc-binding domain protein [Tanacetum cinerariifolium]
MEGLHALVCKAINVGIFKGASEVVVNKFTSKLSLWEARLLSVGGHLTLLKYVIGNLPTYFMSLYHMHVSICSKLESLQSNFFLGSDLGERKMAWVSWKTCLASKKMGGLGIFGRIGGISDSRVHGSSQSPWRGILSMVKSIKLKGVDLLSLCRRCNVANRLSLPDWGSILRRNLRGGIEASQFKDLHLLIEPVVLNSHQDTWTWSLGVLKGYIVASVRSLIDLHSLAPT